eukprot:355390-Chlamydomonas_euryale.AAC.3
MTVWVATGQRSSSSSIGAEAVAAAADAAIVAAIAAAAAGVAAAAAATRQRQQQQQFRQQQQRPDSTYKQSMLLNTPRKPPKWQRFSEVHALCLKRGACTVHRASKRHHPRIHPCFDQAGA